MVTIRPYDAARSTKCLVGLCLGLCAMFMGPAAHAAEILVWSAGAAQTPLTLLIKDYQKSTGDLVKVEFAPVGVLMKRLTDGGQPDVLVLTQDVLATVAGNGWSVAHTDSPLGRVGVGIAIQEGAPLPDISTPEALRQTLLKAKSITYMDPNKGTSGKHFAAVLERLGIAEEIKAKTTLGDVGFVVEPVARGELELGIQQITEILPVKGAKLVGPLPEALQKITTYCIVLGAKARDAASARAFIASVKSEPSQAVFIANGFAAP